MSVGGSGSAGNIITLDGDCSSQGDSSRAKLIAGTGGAVAFSNNSNTYLTIKNMEFAGGSGITQRIVNIAASGNTSATALNITLDNLLAHDTMGEGEASRSVDYQCFRIDGSNVTGTNLTAYNCEGDGFYIEGNDHSWSDIDVSYVDLSGTPYGDCMQYGGGTSSTEYAHNRNVITRLTCDRTNKATKHGVIFGCDSGAGTSTGLVLQDSVIRGGLYNVAVNYCDEVTIRRNHMVLSTNGGTGTARGLGTFSGSSGETINFISNIVDMQNATPSGIGIFIDTSSGFTLKAYNNTIFGNGDETNSFGIYVFNPSSGTVDIKNNLIVGTTGRPISVGASATGTASYNALWNNSAACQTITCSNSVTSNPLLVNNTTPTTTVQYKPRSSSPLKGAGTYLNIGAVQDFGNRRCNDPSTIGAWCFASGDEFLTRTTASTRTNRN